MADTPGTYYKPSGIAPVAGLAMMLIGGLFAGFALSWVYGYLTYYNPFIYINFFATIIFGGAVGGAVGVAGQIGKVRNGMFAVLIGLICGLFALYFGWATWIYVVINDLSSEKITFLESLNPLELIGAILAVNEKGVWGIGSSGEAVTGIFLWILWLIEAGAIVVMSALIPWSILTDTPFCEACDCWADEEEDVAFLEVTENEMLKAALEQQQFEVLTLLPKASLSSATSLHLDLHVCPECKESCYLTVKQVTVSIDKDGDEQKETEELVKNIAIPAEIVEQVRSIMTSDAAPSAPAETADAPVEEISG